MIPNDSWDEAYKNQKDYLSMSTGNLDFLLRQTSFSRNKFALDIGCGTGQLARDLYHRGFNVHGIDLSQEAINYAKDSTVYLENGLHFEVTDIENYPLGNKIYDLITCKYVYVFFNHKIETLHKIKSMMGSKSLFVIISPDINNLPPEKKSIAVEHESLFEQLTDIFENVSYEKRQSDYYYFLKK